MHLRPQGNQLVTDGDILYKFKEGDFHKLRIQDIEDMLLLLVQGKLTNLNVEECLAFNVSVRMFTRSVVIQRRMEDLQLGVESYQKCHTPPRRKHEVELHGYHYNTMASTIE
ncbi:hypothetical protein Tco_0120449, partial [Tanacetum coccineum]